MAKFVGNLNFLFIQQFYWNSFITVTSSTLSLLQNTCMFHKGCYVVVTSLVPGCICCFMLTCSWFLLTYCVVVIGFCSLLSFCLFGLRPTSLDCCVVCSQILLFSWLVVILFEWMLCYFPLLCLLLFFYTHLICFCSF